MIRIFWISILLLSISCTKDCNETIGKIVQKEIEVPHFNKIIANTGVALILKDAEPQRVVVETGENRFDNVHITVEDETIEIKVDEACFLNPSYEAVKVYITSSHIIRLRNSSEHSITSNGILNYPELSLLSEDYENDYNTVGHFNLTVNCTNLFIVSNGMSIFNIDGTTRNLNLQFFDGFGRFDGKNLIVQEVEILHRGENSLTINPQESLKGNIYATGDIISYNRPPVVEVIEHFMGKLIFKPEFNVRFNSQKQKKR